MEQLYFLFGYGTTLGIRNRSNNFIVVVRVVEERIGANKILSSTIVVQNVYRHAVCNERGDLLSSFSIS